MNAPKAMPIIPTIEPPLGRWRARAEFDLEFDFDVFAALEPEAVLLTALLAALVILAADEVVEFVGAGVPIVEDVTQDDVAPAG